jgi:ABC-2 type transport system permease protein
MLQSNSLLTVYTLWQRELVRFYRQPSRVIGALGTPFVFWILIGSGIGTSFRAGKMDYRIYFFPGTILMILLFTAVFSTISLIEDRREGFLQAVLVAPVSRSSFVLAKILGGTTLAVFQGFLFLLIAPWIGIPLTLYGYLVTVLIMVMNAFALTGLGFIIAWRLHSIQGFHAVMNLFLIPLWFLSGALFPQEGAPAWIRLIMRFNPLSYGMTSLQSVLHGGSAGLRGLPPLPISIAVTLFFGMAIFAAASFIASRRSVEDFS